MRRKTAPRPVVPRPRTPRASPAAGPGRVLDDLLGLLDALPVATLLVDDDVRIRTLSGAALEVLGRSAGGAVDRRAGEAFRCIHALETPAGCGHGPHCPACPVRRVVREALRTGKRVVNVEAELELHAGVEGPGAPTIPKVFLASAAPVDFVGARRVLVCLEDVTASRRIEAELRRERDRAQTILDIVHVMVVKLDAGGRIRLVNRRACEVLGRSEAELLGRDWFATCIPAAERDAVRSVFRKIMGGRLQPVRTYENRVRTADGGERVIAWHNTVIRDREGRLAGTLSSGEDVTELRRYARPRPSDAERPAGARPPDPADGTPGDEPSD